MKKTLLSIGLFAFSIFYSNISSAQQTYPYVFSYTTGNAYTQLSSAATQLFGPTNDWDADTLLQFSTPFQFKLVGVAKQNFLADVFGGVDYEAFDVPRIFGLYGGYSKRANSSIWVETTGAAPSRITKLEYRNLGFGFDETPEQVDSASFQIWLHEGSNKIEFHTGQSNTSGITFDMDNSIAIGLIYTENGIGSSTILDTFHFVGYQNNAPKDSIMRISIEDGPASAEDYDFINYGRFPVNGAVFAFTPPQQQTGIASIKKSAAFNLYPNPAKESITLKLQDIPEKNGTLTLSDIAGKVLMTETITNDITSINIANLSSGMYFVTFEDEKSVGKIKFVKQ